VDVRIDEARDEPMIANIGHRDSGRRIMVRQDGGDGLAIDDDSRRL
jgi:hypothetical protein